MSDKRKGSYRPQGSHVSPQKADDAKIEHLEKKPYAFIPVPKTFDENEKEPIWHDGSSPTGRVSGEVRFECTTLTPLLVGWQRQSVGDLKKQEDVKAFGLDDLPDGKSVLRPLRAPWVTTGPVLVPGDSLKGLLRHELGALLGRSFLVSAVGAGGAEGVGRARSGGLV